MGDNLSGQNYYQEEEESLEEKGFSSKITWRRILKTIVALMVIGGLLYLSGLRQYFFYQKTPSQINPIPTDKVVEKDTLTLPLHFWVLENSKEGSIRNLSDIHNMAQKAAKIWQQASINLKIKEVGFVKASSKEIKKLKDSPQNVMNNIGKIDQNYVNIFLIKHLEGVNGIAFYGTNIIIIGDYTSVPDFRVLAHEVGHILGLEHKQDPSLLMKKEAKGNEISKPEALKARRELIR